MPPRPVLRTGLALLLAAGSALAAGPTPTPCVQSGPPPKYDGPYKTVAQLCAEAPRGKPAQGLVPPTGPGSLQQDEAYALKLQAFILGKQYRGLGWLHDAHWRLTGPYQGCPPNGNSFGTHPAVRISYSPEVVAWLCAGRKGPLPDGAMVVKEMNDIDTIVVDPDTQLMSVPQAQEPDGWTVMVKGSAGSADGWYWAFYGVPPPPPAPSPGNPPISTRSAVDNPSLFPPNPTAPNPLWFPTSDGNGDVVYPYAEFGNYCINCHASAVSESTYSSLDNVIGKEILYRYLGADPPALRRLGLHEEQLAGLRDPESGFPSPLPAALPAFLQTFGQLAEVPFAEAWGTRLVAETYDHAVALPPPAGPDPFLSSDQCATCHDATGANASTPNMVLTEKDGTQRNLSPYAEWRASPMGLAGRDPIFFSQLESETNRASREAGLQGKEECIENACLHCHGVLGQRQLALDTGGPTPGRCADFEPPGATGSRLFTRGLLEAWREEDPDNAKYGALGRDGISCTSCHHVAAAGLGQPQSFTGNFQIGPAQEVYGPYKDPLPKPMQHALGITPMQAAQISSPGLCGSCHAIDLPVFKNDGTLVRHSFEQTTYLEWLNSEFSTEAPRAYANGQTCQHCHMPRDFGGQMLSFKIANIEDNTFPQTTDRLPDADLALQPRSPFSRHTLYGANLFLNAFGQQFPLLLGLRQIDFLNGGTVPPLLTARDAALQVVREQTAELALVSVRKSGAGVDVKLTVTNKTGHSLPSGVGFRRLFIELLVLDGNGRPLWASGRTSEVGVILDGLTDRPLPSEFFTPGPDGAQSFQDHHQVVERGDQVQIYEELVQDSDGKFTTSFLHRYNLEVKDNRLRPRGWRRDGPYAQDTRPEGAATLADPDYSGSVLSGDDSIEYRISLTQPALSQARSVQATLVYQTIPPYYLMQRFESAAAGPKSADTRRLFYMGSRLNVKAPAADGQPYLEGWKLRLASASAPLR
jgi:hypothetical protein